MVESEMMDLKTNEKISDKISTTISIHCKNAIDLKLAVSLECSFVSYKDLSEELSRHAKSFLLWTMRGSPLDRSLDKKDHLLSETDISFDNKVNGKDNPWLTSYDIFFNKIAIENNNKYRLVIFENKKQLSDYLSEGSDVVNYNRKTVFEGSIKKYGGQLLFTTVNVLKKHLMLVSNIEFAHIEYGDSVSDAIMFHSEFSSKDTMHARSKQVKIYPYGSAKKGHSNLVNQFRTNHKEALDHYYFPADKLQQLFTLEDRM